MKAFYQRVSSASVTVDGQTVASIGPGVLLLVGVTVEDTPRQAALLARKVAEMRLFTDEHDKFQYAVRDTGGSVLAVSQFTLCANTRHGRRPDFWRRLGRKRLCRCSRSWWINCAKRGLPMCRPAGSARICRCPWLTTGR